MTKTQYTDRIAELQSKGFSLKSAERIAKRERKLQSPQHLAAIKRNAAMAADRLAAHLTTDRATFATLNGVMA